MHPNPAFRPAGDQDLLEVAEAIGFAHIFVAAVPRPLVVHAPVSRLGETLCFHVARANPVAAHLDGARVLLSLSAVDGYVSPNWYRVPGNQVPTWNYVTVEIDGIAAAADAATLVARLDRLAARHEPREAPWTRAKMDPAVFARMLDAIRGFTVSVEAVRGTTKLSQNKPVDDRLHVAAALRQAGRDALADAVAPGVTG